jgi:Capsule polysaccharide biosynthesis protein
MAGVDTSLVEQAPARDCADCSRQPGPTGGMNATGGFHVLLVGWDRSLIDKLGRGIAGRSPLRFSFIMHPRELPAGAGGQGGPQPDAHFLFDGTPRQMPDPDTELLASLEQSGIPTIHNMILGDRVVSKLPNEEALGYATFLARRFQELFRQIHPSVIIGAFDALHSGIALAVARRMEIPWFVMSFSVIPAGLVCFCDRMSPAARVQIAAVPQQELRALAEITLERFESGAARAPAYVTPPPLSPADAIRRLPDRARAVVRLLRRARAKPIRRFTDPAGDHSIRAAAVHLWRTRRARHALRSVGTLRRPPSGKFIFFGLHTQPESSIDVLAPFFSNQPWVIELIARAMPPTHRLLVKIHKSDAAHYSRGELRAMLAYPGVQLVDPFAAAREFIEAADLVISIQGTMGLEAALLGKPVIMLGESPFSLLPSVSSIGTLADLPDLITSKLAEPAPDRGRIVDAYATFLAPFMRASHNDWTAAISSEQIDAYVDAFARLRDFLADERGVLSGVGR